MLRLPTRVLVLGRVALIWFFAAPAAGTVLVQEDFEGLTVGGNLAGQDNWLSFHNRSAIVATGSGVNPTTIADTSAVVAAPNSTGNRRVEGSFGLSSSSVVALQFDSRVSGTSGPHTSIFGIGNNAGNGPGPQFGIQFGVFGFRGDNLGTITNAKTTSNTNVLPTANSWYRIASQWDASTQTGTMWVKNLTAGETTYTQLFFDANRTVSKATLGSLSNITNWNESRLRLGGDSSLSAGSGAADNLFAETTVVLADYRFNNGGFNNSSDAEPHTTASQFLPANISTSSSALGNPSPSMFLNGSTLGAVSQAAAITNGDYLSFSVTPDAITTMSISTLSFDFQRTNSSSPLNYSLFADQDPGAGGDNFSTLLATGLFATTVGDFNTNYFNFAAYLADFAFLQNLTTTTTFRLYLWGGGGAGANARIDNVVLRGSLYVVPEPSSFVLGLLGAALLPPLLRRRRSPDRLTG